LRRVWSIAVVGWREGGSSGEWELLQGKNPKQARSGKKKKPNKEEREGRARICSVKRVGRAAGKFDDDVEFWENGGKKGKNGRGRGD